METWGTRVVALSVSFDREVVLVVAHDGDEDFFGEREVVGVEAAGEDGGPLGHVGHLVDEGVVFAPAGVGKGAADTVEGLADGVAAELDVGHDVGLGEGSGVGCGLGDLDGVGTEEDAVAVGLACGLVAAEGDGHDVRTEEREQPADGADEALGLAGAPVHVLGPVDGGELFGEFGGEDFGGGAAGLGAGGGDVVAFGGGDGLQGFHGDARFFREGDCGGAGDAVFVGDLDGGAEELFGEIGLALGDVVDEDGEAARGGEALGWSAGGDEALPFEQGEGALEEFSLRAGEHACGDFFETYFKEKIHVFLS